MHNNRFQLSKVLKNHSKDVRSVSNCKLANGRIKAITASRDTLINVWDAESGQLEGTLEGHTSFVNCLAVSNEPLNAEDPFLLASGGSDNVVNIWDLKDLKSKPISTLRGHSDNVSCVSFTKVGNLITGSWDKTVKIWKGEDCTQTLEGHNAAVWAVLGLSNGDIVTGSADKTIRVWRNGIQIKLIEKHQGCVRSIIEIDQNRFASCGNDGWIFTFDVEGNLLSELKAHEDFIFTIASFGEGEDNLLASGGEDRDLKIWKKGKCIQCIPHPSTIWSVDFLPNGDLTVGTADCVARIWTRESGRVLKEEVGNEDFNSQVAERLLSAENITDFNVNALLTPEELDKEVGKEEGQMNYVREKNLVNAFMWVSDQWRKVGKVFDALPPKQELEGEEYDYVFDVVVGEENDEKKLKLGYNNSQDPYQASQDFVAKYSLSQKYLDPVASFIIGNAKPEKVGPRPSSFDVSEDLNKKE
eukprot:TRINITY_DN4285_c0_g1_i1.p1 TRINITY_DN4285_c0_g1~~TRINITY_DN4285_c0_g1_i1.p1  ORF type:complete len:471 (+),score=127.07 TRINITY_DN4285_c0_g1_i1:112-1524(+)